MLRITLVVILCVALAGLGVSGVHVHDLGVSHPGYESHDSHTISLLDHHHGTEHAEHGDVDIDPAVKAFGKLTLAQPLLAAAMLLYVLTAVVFCDRGIRLARATPFRPPKSRSAFYFLPPSHAPPATASLR